ncbi:MAG: hypothetical protein U0516_02525 [Candidatus Saccharibacteria bacterium]
MDSKEPTSYNKDNYTDEAKRERFIRVAERRTNRILEDLRLLGNTSNKTLYLYSIGDIEKIFGSIETRLTEVKSKFKTGKNKDKFKLES